MLTNKRSTQQTIAMYKDGRTVKESKKTVDVNAYAPVALPAMDDDPGHMEESAKSVDPTQGPANRYRQ